MQFAIHCYAVCNILPESEQNMHNNKMIKVKSHAVWFIYCTVEQVDADYAEATVTKTKMLTDTFTAA